MSWGISDVQTILLGLKFPQGDINGDITLMLSLQFIQDAGIPEGAISHLSSILLKLIDGSFVDPPHL